ncbi:hypothetical protein Ancab_001674 [Ancistrocladus abbreviatus]
MGPNIRSQHPGLPQPHHSQPPFHSRVKAPGSLGPSFPHGQHPLPSQLPPQPLYQTRQFWFVGDLKIELQASKQREAALEVALAEKEFAEEECRKKVDEAKKREVSLENDLANIMAIIVNVIQKLGSFGSQLTLGIINHEIYCFYVGSELMGA